MGKRIRLMFRQELPDEGTFELRLKKQEGPQPYHLKSVCPEGRAGAKS